MTTTDSEIISRSIELPRAFGELFDRHARDVGRYLARRIGAQHAEDLLSETFLIAFRRRAAFDLSWESAKPWLLGIASNLIRKHRASEVDHWRTLEAWARRGGHETDGDLDAATARVDALSAVRDLAPLLAKLKRPDLDTLLLFAWGDLSYEEIGLALRVPTGTVRSRLNRVRKQLTVAPGVASSDGGRQRVEKGAR